MNDSKIYEADKKEEKDIEEEKGIVNPFSVKDITVSNRTILLPSIITRLKHNEIDIPDYQRHENLWTAKQKSRLIESILLKLPLPVFYFDVENNAKWMVIDGLQRISTIKSFFIETGKKQLKLSGMEFLTELNGKKRDDLSRGMKRTIEETQFITYQIEAQTPMEVRYSLFNRINTGGISLKPQEIRQALNQSGYGVKFLQKIAEGDTFKEIVGVSNKRMAGQELVLRFMAFQILRDEQFKTMANFLDLAMIELDKKNEEELDILENKLISTLNFSKQMLGDNHRFSRSIADINKNKMVNFSLFDTLTVCFNNVEDKNKLLERKDIFVKRLKELLLNESSEFFESITKGTSGKTAKEARFKIINQLIKEIM
jgi:hypothetical protein